MLAGRARSSRSTPSPPAHGYLGQPYYNRAVERAQLKGRAILDDLPATGGSAVETALLEGRPAEPQRCSRASRACTTHARYVVGSRRLGRVRRMLASSVSRQLVATADRPVVVVPATPPA